MIAIIHSLKCTVPFSIVVPLLSLIVTHCHSLSLFVIHCHSLSLVVPLVVTHCHSLSLVVTRCTIRLSFYKRSSEDTEIFLLTFWSCIKNCLNRNIKVNFKIHDFTTWLTNICKTHIVQYLTKQKQPGNEIWSINRI